MKNREHYETPRVRGLSAHNYFLLGIVGLALLVCRNVLLPDRVLFTTDDNIGHMYMWKNMLPYGWWAGWYDSELLGSASPVMFNLTTFLLYLLPAGFFNNWINIFDLVVGSFFLMRFLRLRHLSWSACALGVLTTYWVGSNFTLIYAGHIGKFGILLWVPIFLWLTEKALQRDSLRHALLAGGALGATFLEQADVAFFFALALGPYALFAWWRTFGRWDGRLVRFAVVLFGTAILLAVHPLLSGYQAAVEGVSSVQEEDPAAKWEFVTQWSWPPEESIDFIAPGFTGWRTGEPTGPYTGRMGRSAGWEETGQGFQNFKLENQYIGALPILFAIMALFLVWRRRAPEHAKREIYFWFLVTVLALLLSFGKYFPLYALFYQLPIVSSVRNPNKFLQVFQLALGILSAYGLHELLRQSVADGGKALRFRDIRPVAMGGLLVGVVLIVWGIGSMAAWDSLVDRFAQAGWGRAATVIVENRVWALLHGGVMACLGVAMWYLLTAQRRPGVRAPTIMAWSLIGVVIVDVLFLSRHYVQTVEATAFESNPVIERIRADRSGSRVALVTQEGFYNQWLSQLFPYHDIKTINVAQMPRMPIAYQQYLAAVGGNPIRHWELGAVGYILGPAHIWNQITNEPTLQDRFELFFAYTTEPIAGGVRVIPATEQRPGQHVLLRHLAPHPRYALVAGWEVMDDAAALRRLASPTFTPFEQVLIASDSVSEGFPEPEGQGISGSVRTVRYRPGYVQLRVSAEEPSILRLADKHNPHWKAEVNGVPVPVLRVDYLMQGVYVAPGLHDVTLRYAPPTVTLWVQGLGMALCVGALILLLRERVHGLPPSPSS